MSYIATNVYPTQGFHPISSNIVHFSTGSLSLVQCSFHLYFKLPPLLFVDPHELAQRNNTYTFNHWGSRDLEKPVHALPEAGRGSEVLLNVRLPPSIDDDIKPFEVGSVSRNMTVDLPMHLRYGVPAPVSSTSKSGKSYVHVQVDAPIAFLLCKTSRELFLNPFFLLSLTLYNLATLVDNPTYLPASLPSHVTLSLPKTPPNIFIPIPAHSEFLSGKANLSYTNVVTVPLGSISDLAFVELGTTLTIVICFFWLARVSWNTSKRLVRHHLKPE